MPTTYRNANPEDAPACVELRGKTRENAVSVARLAEVGITADTWAADIRTGKLPGRLCHMGGELVGYCFADVTTGEVVVLALLPHAEGQGIGKALLAWMVADLHQRGFKRLFLGCASDPAVRSYGFYRHLGWRSTGAADDRGDEILELWLPAGA